MCICKYYNNSNTNDHIANHTTHTRDPAKLRLYTPDARRHLAVRSV